MGEFVHSRTVFPGSNGHTMTKRSDWVTIFACGAELLFVLLLVPAKLLQVPNVTFIRHAQSASNAGLVTHDFSQIELTPEGLRQASELADSWKETPSLIITSSFLRAVQTAQPTMNRFSNVPVDQWPVQEFTNLEPAIWNGTRPSDRIEAVDEYWRRQDPGFLDGPSTESFSSFLRRVEAAMIRLANLPHDRVLVFTHGYFMHAARLHASFLDQTDAERMAQFRDAWQNQPIANCALFHLKLG